MAKAQELVVADKVSRFGLHILHVVRAGSPVDRGCWMEGKEVEAVYEYEEKEIGMWHLRLWWKKEGTAEVLPCPYDGDGGGDEGQ